MLHGDTRLTKASPLKYLESFLKEYSPECKNKWVVMDNGGKLYSNPKIWNLFATFGYEIYPTSPDSSNQNGPVERAHCTVSQGIKALLFGAGLNVKFWPYVFIHVLRIRNALPGQGQDASPLFLSTGRKDNFRNLQIFGCRVWVRPIGLQKKQFKDDVRKGIFLGYVPHTDQLITGGRTRAATLLRFRVWGICF